VNAQACSIRSQQLSIVFWQVCIATHDRDHADKVLEDYVTTTVMNVVIMFFSSPFSDQSTTLQVLEALSPFYTVPVSLYFSHWDYNKMIIFFIFFNSLKNLHNVNGSGII